MTQIVQTPLIISLNSGLAPSKVFTSAAEAVPIFLAMGSKTLCALELPVSIASFQAFSMLARSGSLIAKARSYQRSARPGSPDDAKESARASMIAASFHEALAPAGIVPALDATTMLR